jgi:SpoVK/Ycf46/Vps4 family AAA+-type ATPase
LRVIRKGFLDASYLNSSPDSNTVNEISQAFTKALEDMRALGQKIIDASASTDQVWFRNLLVGIIDCALKDQHNVQIGIQKFIPLVAWATRNLLEFRIVTSYVLRSGSNTNQFKTDLLIDVKEFYENVSKIAEAARKKIVANLRDLAEQQVGPLRDTYTKLAEAEAAKQPQTEIADQEAEACRKLLAQFGIKDNGQPMMHGALAHEIREHEDFGLLNKICSKITHRTAFSIASTHMPDSLDELKPFLSIVAKNEIMAIYGMIKDYFRDNGVVPPK